MQHQILEWLGTLPQAFPGRMARQGGQVVEPQLGAVMVIICAFDGALRRESHAAYGLVVQDEMGVSVMVKPGRLEGVYEPEMVELIALREAYHWCVVKGLSLVQIQGNSIEIIDRVNARCMANARGGAL
ncbi:unnamed protein product [Linum trigynum]|uniref:RNase H type-1 domain-containing protein n=1 Tax=Linum trigynum TaxID=586398 RepID=A0AAV2CK69_9ROSI